MKHKYRNGAGHYLFGEPNGLIEGCDNETQKMCRPYRPELHFDDENPGLQPGLSHGGLSALSPNAFREFKLAGKEGEAATPLGLVVAGAFTQGSSFVATLG